MRFDARIAMRLFNDKKNPNTIICAQVFPLPAEVNGMWVSGIILFCKRGTHAPTSNHIILTNQSLNPARVCATNNELAKLISTGKVVLHLWFGYKLSAFGQLILILKLFTLHIIEIYYRMPYARVQLRVAWQFLYNSQSKKEGRNADRE